jgi:16S rRNA (adenine1518-N6/adenine1519-N6)-dimethyltransferase
MRWKNILRITIFPESCLHPTGAMQYLCSMQKQLESSPYRLKKSLGQHFLRDENICKKIVEELRQQPFQQLVEVGPGGGALTKFLLNVKGIDFKAVEIDDEKVAYLKRIYPVLTDKIIHKSILDIPPPFEKAFTVVGNFPYNISTEIVFKVLDWKDQVECMIGMFQKEVAQRLASKPGSKVYGVTSVLVQAFFSVEYLFDVPPEAFEPPPKVVSGVIRLLPRNDTNPTPAMRSERDFKILVKTAFNQRRKQLRNGLKPLFAPEVLADDLFTKRAEQLSVEDFAALTFKMNGNG